MQPPQSHSIERLQQLLESLPDCLAFIDEAIDGHKVDFRFYIFDFRFRLNSNVSPEGAPSTHIANQKSKIENRLVECVPNFSEGRKAETVERIAKAIASAPGAAVLNRHLDPDHNRSVITFVAASDKIVEAALRAVATATELIDLHKHGGEHPRIGATDVLPFIPVSGVTLSECVSLAHQAGQRIWNELRIPVYFYERAARRPDRARLEHVRGQGYERLHSELATDRDRAPDIGDPQLHPTAGAIAVGARPFLIAFNINLRTKDISIARRIAHTVRERDGGLPFLKALGFELQSRGLVQVSMNLIDCEQTTIAQAFAAVQTEAKRLRVEIAGAEIVGLLPRAALDRKAPYFPLLENFREELVLETLLEDVSEARL
jgi:glutamate formiminotransferase/glutamate formiminotransferase/formiminotetrahydrofolate cyclodeaminase